MVITFWSISCGSWRLSYLKPARSITISSAGLARFRQPRLQTRHGALVANPITGLVWGAWHIPVLVYTGSGQLEMALAVVGTVPAAIIYTWLYNYTRGSMLLAVLLHLGQQFSQNLLGAWPGYADEILMLALAIGVVVVSGAAKFSRKVPGAQPE